MCDSCGLLKSADLCNTNVEEIPEHCTSLREVLLPTTLHTIRVKAFMNCAALIELAIPPSLRYTESRAFLDCTVFGRLAKMPGTNGEESMLKRMLSPFVLLCDATLPAYDPRRGVYPCSWMKTSLSGRSKRGLTVTR